ncbi:MULTISPECIES: flagellar hook-basal body complex protein FliE [unclassified Hahella]|uniref:flagellar hook-basal body complex protein FliE n=1 Tax=unclassified Hahella TaxID=2624107 RepID=UPI001C1EE5F1|nr:MULTISPECIES: flagellar hook-basal body complex protein FliE [unclassified Hahella]MBU6955230.1 flagellar hook-basal body complex protein FliE [Hahella sp. HN01]WLQ15703.1 flagellar hook-basal body complex protein FliE [Hahella sp. HNIBRBA332]
MTVEAILGVGAIGESSLLQKSAKTSGVSFADWLGGEVQQVNQQIAAADSAARSLATGDAENLHQVMIALDKAQLSMSLMVEVRNRLLESYQEVMRMSI